MYIFIILFLVSDILIVDRFDSHNHLSKLFVFSTTFICECFYLMLFYG